MSLPIEEARHGAIPPAVKNATFISEYFQSFEVNKLLPSSYLEVSKFSLKMNFFFYHFKLTISGLWAILLCSIFATDIQQCTICLQPLKVDYLVDAWGNAFHSKHEKEGLFCYSHFSYISILDWIFALSGFSSCTTPILIYFFRTIFSLLPLYKV